MQRGGAAELDLTPTKIGVPVHTPLDRMAAANCGPSFFDQPVENTRTADRDTPSTDAEVRIFFADGIGVLANLRIPP